MSYVSPTALARPERPLVARSLLLLAIVVHLVGLARLVPHYRDFQALVARGDATAHYCILGAYLSPRSQWQQVMEAPRLFGLRGDTYLTRAPWVFGLSSLVLVGSALVLLGPLRAPRRRRALSIMLIGSGLVLGMLHFHGFCQMPGGLN